MYFKYLNNIKSLFILISKKIEILKNITNIIYFTLCFIEQVNIKKQTNLNKIYLFTSQYNLISFYVSQNSFRGNKASKNCIELAPEFVQRMEQMGQKVFQMITHIWYKEVYQWYLNAPVEFACISCTVDNSIENEAQKNI